MIIAILIFSILSFVALSAWSILFFRIVYMDEKNKQKEIERLSVNTALTRATKEELENALKNNDFIIS